MLALSLGLYGNGSYGLGDGIIGVAVPVIFAPLISRGGSLPRSLLPSSSLLILLGLPFPPLMPLAEALSSMSLATELARESCGALVPKRGPKTKAGGACEVLFEVLFDNIGIRSLSKALFRTFKNPF